MANAHTIAFQRFTEWKWQKVNKELEEKRKAKQQSLELNASNTSNK